MFPCFLGGFFSRLVESVAQRQNQLSPRRPGLDDLVHEPARRRDERTRELLAELGDAPRALGGGILRRLELLLVQHVDRAFGPHHRDLGRRPRIVEVGAQVLARHHAIRAAVRLARDHRHLRHGRLGKRV